jgi:hypothetical protein
MSIQLDHPSRHLIEIRHYDDAQPGFSLAGEFRSPMAA